MSVNSIQSGEQASELYTIRARRQEQTVRQAQEVSQSQQAQQVQAEQRAAEADTYDKDNPVGVQAEGVYSLSHDEEGNLTISYTRPASKSDDTEESESSQSAKAGSSQGGEKASGAGASSAVSSTSSDDDDTELDELEQQRDAIRQQLNREQDEAVKAQLRVQLQSIETQIALKSAGVEA
ncbi:MAG: hypothetical protein IJP86_06165 [Synergistaceae bacterium]|nr:hypothetical protein [Synergistaceae bacterium]